MLAISRLSIAALCLALSAGCSTDPPQGIVSGTVTVDGQPAENGSIAFFPIDGRTPTAGGAISAGRYSVAVPPGECRIEIRISKRVGERKLYNTAESPMQPTLKEVLPAKYNDKSELKYSVAAGKQEKNWEINTK